MKKISRPKSLKYYILLPLILIILFQASVFASIIVFSNTSGNLDQKLFRVLDNTVAARDASLEQQFSSFVNMDTFYQAVTMLTIEKSGALGLSIRDYTADAGNRQTLLGNLTPAVLRALRLGGATSCFVILDGEEGSTQKDALYLRDFNPSDSPENNSDVLIEAGPSQILYDYALTTSAQWTSTLDVDKDCSFYQTAFDGGNTYTELSALDLGYFSMPVRIHPNDMLCITYSIPLLDGDHHSYGVIGFDMTLDYLKKLLPSHDITLDEYGSYFLATTEDFETAQSVLVVNDTYYSMLEHGTDITMNPRSREYNIYDLGISGLDSAINACIHPLRFYSAKSPYRTQQWILCGLIRTNVLFASSRQLNVTVVGAIGLSLLLSITGTLLITHIFMKPINTLNDGIRKLLPGYSTLPRTRIAEFDNLSAAIEEQNISIYSLGNKMAEIIELTGVSLGVCEFDPKNDMVYCTHKFFEILDLPDDGWDHNHISKTLFTSRITQYNDCFVQSHENPEEYRYQRPGCADKWLDIKQNRKEDNILITISDITERRAEQEKIIHDRDYDILTGLYNRRAFSREMKYLIDEGHCSNGVLSIWDLDNLKYTNDTYGHEIGDKYICTLSDLLKKELPQNSVSARLAGDEFTVFLYDEPRQNLVGILKSIHRMLMKERLSLPDGHELNMSASAGMAFYNEDASNYAELLKYADFAMYQIKKSSKGSIKAYNKDSYVRDYILVQGVGELDRIIIDEAVRYAYQPIISVQTGEIFAYEALIRPVSDLLGNPDNLLRVAEAQFKLDKIERLTWFHALKGFFDQIRDDDNAHIFINSIPNQLLSEEDWQMLEDLYGDRLSRIVMEITENARSEIEIDAKKRAFCRKWNIPIALDDFGSGYSNSDMLVTRLFHYVKLDMGLIKNIDQTPSTQALVRSTIDYCHQNQLRVIAEGIETQSEYDTVKDLGVDFVQGFFLAKPAFDLY